MSFRLRMMVILLAMVATGLSIIALAYVSVTRMYDRAEELVVLDLGRSQARTEIRDALERTWRAQERHGSEEGGSVFQVEVFRQLDALDAAIDDAKPRMARLGQGSHSDMREQSGKMREMATVWADLLSRENTEVERTAVRIAQRTPALRGRLADLHDRAGGRMGSWIRRPRDC